jgi:uncharacterized membrane protein YkoI
MRDDFHRRLIRPDYRRERPASDRKERTVRGRILKIGVGAVVIAGLAGGGAAWATAGGGDESPLTGKALERATAAALAHTGGGTVTETESGDDGAAYSVEVRLADGRQVEVGLDSSFHVIDRSTDDDGSSDEDGASDD